MSLQIPPVDPAAPRRFVRLTRDHRTARRDVDHGRLVRLTRGVAMYREDWAELDHDQRRWLRTEAVLATVGDPGVISHGSAATYWRLPLLHHDPRVHVTDPGLVRTRSGPNVVRHAAPLETDEVVDAGGLRVTTLRRTTVDIARSRSFEDSVVLFDHLLNSGRAERSQLRGALGAWSSNRGVERALAALGFADARSDSPGESRSRIAFHRLGLPAPVLQQPFVTDAGTFRVDFWWPEFGVVGEFDGRVKYEGALATRGRTVLYDEKRREDALRRLEVVRGVARWGTAELEGDRLEPLLRSAGLLAVGPRFA